MTRTRMPTRRRSFLHVTGAVAMAAVIAAPTLAQTVSDTPEAPEASLNIPANAQIFGGGNPNVYRPSATVNGEIITATDVEQRIAIIRIANDGNIPADQLPALRVQVFNQLIDEILQVQEAKANKIEIAQSDIDSEFARIAAGLRQTPEQFAAFLTANGASVDAMKRQIKGSIAWQSVLGRNVEPFAQVSQEEVQSIVDRRLSQRGATEFRVGEIYLPATPDTLPAVRANAARIIEALGQGASFQDYARRFSQATTASVGGDLGWVKADQLPPSLASAAQSMSPGQLAGPIEAPGGLSILYLIDRRQVLTADPRDATLSLKQVALTFAPGTTEARATELTSAFAARTQTINGCGQAESVAETIGATVVSRDQIAMRDLPPPLQAALAQMQVGQVTPPFGSPTEGVSVLVLCGRDLPPAVTVPSMEDVAEGMRTERVNRRAQRYLRDLRRDAIIDYS